MPNPIHVVAGLGRCGSSLLMRMLKAGGMEILTDWGPPLYEHTGIRFLQKELATVKWDNDTWPENSVIKCLGLPPPDSPPVEAQYKIIFLQRDPREQAKSWMKFYDETGRDYNGCSLDLYEKMVGAKSDMIREHWKKRGEVLVIPFEALIKAPRSPAKLIRRSWGLPLDVNAMTAIVRPRDTKCMEGFLEPEVYKEETGEELDFSEYCHEMWKRHQAMEKQ